MCKKLSILTVVLVFLVGGSCFLKRFSLGKPCVFCNRVVLNNQKFYEDDLVLALYTHKPILSSHCLIIPKRHIERFEMLTDAEITQMGSVIKKINQAAMKVFGTSSYLLLQKNGVEVGQSVPHIHFHYIARKAGDNSILWFLIKMWVAAIKQPILQEEMDDITEKLRQAIE